MRFDWSEAELIKKRGRERAVEGGFETKEKMAERITTTNKKPEKQKIIRNVAERRI